MNGYEKVKNFKPRHVNKDVIKITTNFRMCNWDHLLNQENGPFVTKSSSYPQQLASLSAPKFLRVSLYEYQFRPNLLTLPVFLTHKTRMVSSFYFYCHWVFFFISINFSNPFMFLVEFVDQGTTHLLGDEVFEVSCDGEEKKVPNPPLLEMSSTSSGLDSNLSNVGKVTLNIRKRWPSKFFYFLFIL